MGSVNFDFLPKSFFLKVAKCPLSLFWCFMGRDGRKAIGLFSDGTMSRAIHSYHSERIREGKHQKRDDVVDDAQINQDKYISLCVFQKSFKFRNSKAGFEPTICSSSTNAVDHYTTEDSVRFKYQCICIIPNGIASTSLHYIYRSTINLLVTYLIKTEK